MEKRIFTIKNMVCQRCIEAVVEVFQQLEISPSKVELGKVETLVSDDFNEDNLAAKLQSRGFDLVKSKEEVLVEKTKAAIVKLVHYLEENPLVTNSIWLENELNENYQKISKNFSALTGLTLEKYLISHKMEKVKELIQYRELSFEHIALKLGYKSLSHLSKQFKEVEKLSLTDFKKNKPKDRNKLENL